MSDEISAATDTPASPLAEKLAAVKAERARIAKEREDREEANALAAELEDESRKLDEDKAIDAAETAYGPLEKKIAAVHTPAGLVIVKKAHHVLFKRFQDSGEASTEEFYKLVTPCVVYPDKAAFASMLQESPGIIGQVASAVSRLAGVKMKEVSGK